jgi:hypothetical protein
MAVSPAQAAARHTVVAGAKRSAGQSALVPVQDSATSQTPAEARQVTVAGSKVQTPSTVAPAATLQAWQSLGLLPPQAEAQHTPSTQNPEAHSASTAHGPPSATGFTQCHVSERKVLLLTSPPNSTTFVPNVAIACPTRAGGLVAGVRCVQVSPSHSHVSETGGRPKLARPPNSTTLEPSVAIACWMRTGGLVAGLRCVQLAPSHSHVSERRPLAPAPPNSTTFAPSVTIAW